MPKESKERVEKDKEKSKEDQDRSGSNLSINESLQSEDGFKQHRVNPKD